jgi:hypothetical protein
MHWALWTELLAGNTRMILYPKYLMTVFLHTGKYFAGWWNEFQYASAYHVYIAICISIRDMVAMGYSTNVVGQGA